MIAATAWAARHSLRGHRVWPGRSPAYPAVIVWRCHRCGLIRQLL